MRQSMSEPIPNPVPRAIWCPHVTVASIVCDGERFLMVEEAIHGRLVINQPAGHLEDGETLADAARREALEETAFEIALDAFVGVGQWHSPVHRHHIVRFAFAGHAIRQHPERALDAGITRTLWMTYAEIAAAHARLRSPLVLSSLDDWLAGRRLPLTMLRSLLPVREARACA